MPVTDDIRRLELAQLDMTAGLFTVLDSILSSIVPPPAPVIKAGGYPEELFVTLTERDKDEFECCICYMILKDAQQCVNKHKFCSSCILAWTLNGSSLGADKCPFCRVDGEYKPCDIVNARLGYKRVKCQEENCDWTGFLKDFESHEHNQYNAPLKPGVKRSLPAIAGTIRSSNRSGPNTTLTTSTGHAGASGVRATPRNPVTAQPGNATRSRAEASSFTGTNRPTPRPTPRLVRQNNRQPNANATITPTLRNANNPPRRQTSTNTGRSTSVERGQTSNGRPNSVVRAVPASDANANASAADTATSPQDNDASDTSVPQRSTEGHNDESSTPRPAMQATLLLRRRPSTPNRLLNQGAERESDANATSVTSNTTTSNVVAEASSNNRPSRLPPISAASMGNNAARTYRQSQFREMAGQIREGRSQLQGIMHILSDELETRRQSIARHQEFQEQQQLERLRQLHEVHTLGQRLGEVANNLASLMNGLRGSPRRNQSSSGNDD